MLLLLAQADAKIRCFALGPGELPAAAIVTPTGAEATAHSPIFGGFHLPQRITPMVFR